MDILTVAHMFLPMAGCVVFYFFYCVVSQESFQPVHGCEKQVRNQWWQSL